jgi:Xaa-Pro aminopeptidase
MSNVRSLLPLHEREAARAALEEVVERAGNQTAAAEVLGVSQAAINKAILHKTIGPSILRVILDHFKFDVRELVERYGDASSLPEESRRPKTVKDEAIIAAVRYGGGISEKDVRAMADRLEPLLDGRPLIAWLEALLREIQHDYIRPMLEKKAATRAEKSEQRRIRKLQAVRQGRGIAAPVAVDTEAKKASR